MGFINEDVIIDFEFPVNVDDYIEYCEQYSKEGYYCEYKSVASFFVNKICKNLYAKGQLTMKQWETVKQRYKL